MSLLLSGMQWRSFVSGFDEPGGSRYLEKGFWLSSPGMISKVNDVNASIPQ